ETGLGCTGKRLAFLADGFARTGLCHRGADRKRSNQDGNENTFHYFLHTLHCGEKIRTRFEKIAVRPHHGLHEQNAEILEEFRSCSSISSRLRLLVPKLDSGPIRNHPT